MGSDARGRWNRRHATGSIGSPSRFLTSLAPLLPGTGTAIDVAGGTGRNALWLAERGLDATLVDISEVGLATALTEASNRGLKLTTLRADLESEPFPAGVWDVVACFHYLHRPLFPAMAEAVALDGVLLCEIATVRNLERHERPPRRFLLDEGELGGLVTGLEQVLWEEGWTSTGRHTARLIARRSLSEG
ncbi:MAG: class I SAM-dependent methyltransferase [Acidimicrobiia bacterium]